VHPTKGRLVFVDRNVDPQTGTILMEAAFPNPGAIVRPGQYARVRAAVDLKKGAILVPQRAISELQGIYNVAVVGADDTIEMRMVKPSDRIGTLWVVDSGLKAGERVVVEGLQKVRPGIKVKPESVKIEEGGPAPAAAEAKGGQG
jgi:membrane fusion protein, multidrug efflux system